MLFTVCYSYIVVFSSIYWHREKIFPAVYYLHFLLFLFTGVITINTSVSLYSLPIGQIARVSALKFDGAVKRRLLDLGIIEGTEIKALYRSPAGNPIAYLIRGAVIAFRTDISEKIYVSQS